MLVTLLSGLLAACFPALNASWVVIGGIVPMVPGVTFTTSIREFFNGDYLSGVIHCICAMLTAVCIALGVCGGAMLLGFMGGDCAVTGQVLAAFLGVLSFAVLFHAPRRSYLACAVCGAVAWGCYLLAAPLGLFLATTLAAIALTLLSRMLSIAMKMPSTVFIVTGIFPLVPGAGIYHTAYALVSRNMEAFTLRGMQTLALAGAIALGILIGMGFPKLLV
ncbi:MAG: threonine/serine exporter family protein, partial [Christensenellales bacterium]